MSLKFCLYICSFVLVSNLDISNCQEEAPLVQVKQGLIRGTLDKSLNGREFHSYMGIPYAEPPLGKLRFKDPVPKEPWEGVLNATKMPQFCVQISFTIKSPKSESKKNSTSVGTEDCLQLNVYTPVVNDSKKSKEKLPVMFFIHGGGFIVGGANYSEPHVLMNENVVLVVIQYRLGIFGFLSTEDSVMPGNMGLKDQQLALKWVNENIEAFGGDVNSITIFGQSAGAGSVHYQMLSPGSKGLFHRAIMMSGTSLCPWASRNIHRKYAIETGQKFNCSVDSGTELFLECMQNAPAFNLSMTTSQLVVFGLSPTYALPRVDGVFIEEAPEVLMKNGKYNKVDVVAGITKDEGGFLLLLDFWHSQRINENFDEVAPTTLLFHEEKDPLDLTKQVYKHYLQRDNFTTTKADWKEMSEMYTDRMFKVCHDNTVNFLAADPDVKLYLYQLDHFGQLSIASYFGDFKDFDRKNLTMHGDDTIYLFFVESSRKNLENEEDLKVRKIFVDLWTNFSRSGNPTPSGYDFVWPEATPESFQFLSLTPSPIMKNFGFQEKRKFWSSLNTTQNQLLGIV